MRKIHPKVIYFLQQRNIGFKSINLKRVELICLSLTDEKFTLQTVIYLNILHVPVHIL